MDTRGTEPSPSAPDDGRSVARLILGDILLQATAFAASLTSVIAVITGFTEDQPAWTVSLVAIGLIGFVLVFGAFFVARRLVGKIVAVSTLVLVAEVVALLAAARYG